MFGNLKDLSPRALKAPSETWTESSIVLVWDKPEDYNEIESYEINLNGKCIGGTSKTCFKVDKLDPETEYILTVNSKDGYGKVSSLSKSVCVKTLKSGTVIDVTKPPYNAKGDGITLNTAKIQKAIDDCTPEGTVYIPEGLFKVSGLFLKSDMTLKIEGTLIGSENIDDYSKVIYRFGDFAEFSASMINIGRIDGPIIRNVKILGKGTINANGELLIKKFEERGESGSTSYSGRNSCFTSINSENVYIEGVSFRNSACWCVHPIWTENITFYGVYLNNTDYKVHNGDGINPDACKNVKILNCTIDSQDDNISVKNGNRDDRYAQKQRACEDVLISDCILREGFGFSPGLESYYGVRRVTLRDCEFYNASSLCHAICTRDFFALDKGVEEPILGGTIEDICVRDVKFFNNKHRDNMWMRGPIDIDMYYTAGPMDHPDFDTPNVQDEYTPHINNILIQNVVIVDESDRHVITMAGRPESKLKNIVIKDLYAKSTYGIKGINIENITLDNVSIENEKGELYYWHNVEALSIRPNLVTNPGFEQGDEGWSLFDTKMAKKILTEAWPNYNDVYSGKYSLKLNTCRSYAVQDIKAGLKSGGEYILKAYGKIKTHRLYEGGKGVIKAMALDARGEVIENGTAVLNFEAEGYTVKEAVMLLPERTVAVRIEIKTEGPVFFADNIALYPVEK